MKAYRSTCLAMVVVLACSVGAYAQLTRGSVTGTVRDETGGVVPGVQVTAVNESSGVARVVVSDGRGFYRIGALEPGRYTIRAELSGFATKEVRGVPLVPTQEATYNPQLSVATGEAITVEADSGAVELNKTNATLGLVSSSRQATELPLSAARNINNLALLAPGAFAAPGSSGISANGNRARNNNFMVDGTDNNDMAVTVTAAAILPEELGEFSVQTAAFSAEFGRSSGAQINVVTRSGGNLFKGEVWDFYRTSGLNSLDNLQKAAGLTDPPKSIRHQAGLSLGGPIVKNKTHFFALFQRDSLRTGDLLGATTRIITREGLAALRSAPLRVGQTAQSRQSILERLSFFGAIHDGNPVYRNVQNLLVNGVAVQTGQVNLGRKVPNTTLHPSIRLDHQLGPSDSLTLRYTRNDSETLNNGGNTAFGAPFAASSLGLDQNTSLSHTHVFGSTSINEVRASLVRRDLDFPENDPVSPTAIIAGLFTVGGGAGFPQSRLQNSYQVSDTFSTVKNRHSLKIGFDVRYNRLDNEAAFDSKGTFTFNNLQDYLNNIATTYTQALQTASFDARQWQVAGFIQDDFRITPAFTVNLGLRYEIGTTPFGFFGATDAQSLGALVPGPLKKDQNNLAPRLGFAWSPSGSGLFGEGKSSIRGGYGISYDVLFWNILSNNAANFPRVVTLNRNNVIDQYPAIQQGGATATFDPAALFVNSAEKAQSPTQHFYSLSWQREFGRHIVAEVGYAGSTGRHGINQVQMNPAVLTADQIATVLRTGSNLSIPTTQQRRVFPQVGSRILIPSDVGPGGGDMEARSQFHSGFIAFNKRMSHGVQVGLAYTLSRLMSNNDEALGVAAIAGGSPQVPQDYFDIASEWSRSAFDRTHRLVVNYIWEVPGPKKGVFGQILGGWQLAGVTATQSGQPFTIRTGIDTNGNGDLGGDRPNINPSGSIVPDPTHGWRTFTNNGYYVVPRTSSGAVLAASLGNGNGLRNAHRAEGFWNTDLSLSKRFSLGRHRLTVRLDAFNAFDQDDVGIPVNAMSNADFGRNNNNWGARTITLGAKYAF